MGSAMKVGLDVAQKLFAEGRSTADTAAFLGVREDFLRRRCRAAGIECPDQPPNHKNRKLPAAAEMKSMIESGTHPVTIAEDAGVTVSAVYAAMRRAGIDMQMSAFVERRHHRNRLLPGTAEIIMQLEEGETPDSIAAEAGVRMLAVYTDLRYAGFRFFCGKPVPDPFIATADPKSLARIRHERVLRDVEELRSRGRGAK